METLNIQQNIFTKYHYRVWVYVSTLNADKFKTDAISDTDDFTNPDLKIARDAAVNRYWQIYETMHQSKGFFLPFAAADNFETDSVWFQAFATKSTELDSTPQQARPACNTETLLTV